MKKNLQMTKNSIIIGSKDLKLAKKAYIRGFINDCFLKGVYLLNKMVYNMPFCYLWFNIYDNINFITKRPKIVQRRQNFDNEFDHENRLLWALPWYLSSNDTFYELKSKVPLRKIILAKKI